MAKPAPGQKHNGANGFNRFGSLRGRFGVDLGSISGRFGVDLGGRLGGRLVVDAAEPSLGSTPGLVGVASRQLRCRSVGQSLDHVAPFQPNVFSIFSDCAAALVRRREVVPRLERCSRLYCGAWRRAAAAAAAASAGRLPQQRGAAAPGAARSRRGLRRTPASREARVRIAQLCHKRRAKATLCASCMHYVAQSTSQEHHRSASQCGPMLADFGPELVLVGRSRSDFVVDPQPGQHLIEMGLNLERGRCGSTLQQLWAHWAGIR